MSTKRISTTNSPINNDATQYINGLTQNLQPIYGTTDVYSVDIDLDMLFIDTDYQTEWRQARKSKLCAATWVWYLYTPILVNLRKDGTLVVYDGAHRARVALEELRIPKLRAHVAIGLTKEQEIKLFIEQDIMPLKMNPREKWLARRAIPDPTIIYLDEVLAKYNFRVKDKYERNNNVYKINAIERIMKTADAFDFDTMKRWANYAFACIGLGNYGIYDGAGTKKEIIDGLTDVFLEIERDPTITNKDAGIVEPMLRIIVAFKKHSPNSLQIIADDLYPSVSNHEKRMRDVIKDIAMEHANFKAAEAKLDYDKITTDAANAIKNI